MVFYVHPLTIVVLPAILCIYAVLEERKRLEAQYKVTPVRRLRASHSLGEEPQHVYFRWNVGKSVEEYERLVDKAKEQNGK